MYKQQIKLFVIYTNYLYVYTKSVFKCLLKYFTAKNSHNSLLLVMSEARTNNKII